MAGTVAQPMSTFRLLPSVMLSGSHDCGQSVILEDGTWKRAERDRLRGVASEMHAITEIHCFDLSVHELWRRLEIRNGNLEHGTAPITRELLEDCLLRFEKPDDAELSLFDRSVVHDERWDT